MRSLSGDHLTEIFDAFAKSGYEPQQSLFDALASVSIDELSSKGIQNIYDPILKQFEKSGTTSSDPLPLPIVG